MLQFKDFYLRKARNIKRDMSRKRGYQLGELYLYVVAVNMTRVRGYQYNPNPTPQYLPPPHHLCWGGFQPPTQICLLLHNFSDHNVYCLHIERECQCLSSSFLKLFTYMQA